MSIWLTFVTYLSLAWGIFINLAVASNQKFALPIAAGGKFENFPKAVRIVYFIQSVWICYQTWIFYQLISGNTIKPSWIIFIFISLGLIGTLLNLISRSKFERLNAIPLALITYSFWLLR